MYAQIIQAAALRCDIFPCIDASERAMAIIIKHMSNEIASLLPLFVVHAN